MLNNKLSFNLNNPLFKQQLFDQQGNYNHPLLVYFYLGARDNLIPESYYQLMQQNIEQIKTLDLELQTQYLWLLFYLQYFRDYGHSSIEILNHKSLDLDYLLSQLDDQGKLWLTNLETTNLLELYPEQPYQELDLNPNLNLKLITQIAQANPYLLMICDQTTTNAELINLEINNNPLHLLYAFKLSDEVCQLTFSGIFKIEQTIKQQLLKRAQAPKLVIDQQFAALLAKSDYLVKQSVEQQNAVNQSLGNILSVIVGGPGTGKTTTVRKLIIINAVSYYLTNNKLPKIALTAPTGKAAIRLEESVNNGLVEDLELIKQLLAERLTPQQIEPLMAQIYNEFNSATTLHSVLGFPKSTKYGNGQALDYDILIVDEASMIDLSLFNYCLKALMPQTQLIILGDPNQLPAVGLGSVLGALQKQASYQDSPVAKVIKSLTKNFRSGDSKYIAELGKRISLDQASAWLNSNQDNFKAGDSDLDLEIYDPLLLVNRQQQLLNQIILDLEGYFDQYWQLVIAYLATIKELNGQATPAQLTKLEQDRSAIIAEFKKNRILLANRKGKFGINNFNQLLEKYFYTKYLESLEYDATNKILGTPIQITRSNRKLDLINGELGIILPTLNPNQFKVYIQRNNGMVEIPLELVIHYELAYAITVHKSQGDEFNNTFVIFPPQLNDFHSKEIFYTAITRAKKYLRIYAPQILIEQDLMPGIKQSTLNYQW